MKYFISILIWVFFSGCASTPQKISAIDAALTDIQSNKAEQGRAALEKMCTDGSDGPCALLGKSIKANFPVPILQGLTSANQSRFMVVTPAKDKLIYYVRSNAGVITRLTAEFFSEPGATSGVDQIEAFALDPKQNYELIVLGNRAQLWDRRAFRSLDTAKRRPRLAIASALDDRYRVEQAKIWPELLRQNPDVLLLIGDNVFVDRGPAASVSLIWKRYAESRANLALYQANPLVPTLATWDDHDYGKNDSDRTFPLKAASTDAFFAFFAQRRVAPGFERGPGIASWWSAFGVHVALLDDRSFRSPDGVDVPDQTHFGLDQEKWLLDLLHATKEPVLLVSGDQFFGGYHKFESYEGNHPASFKARLEDWKGVKVPLIFISGDRHLSEIIKVPPERLGYSTFELTSSGIHAKVYPDAFIKDPNPLQLVGAAGAVNYMMIEIMRRERGLLQLDVQALTLGEKQLYQKTLTVKH